MKKKAIFPGIYLAVIMIITYIPIILTVIYSFNESKLTSVWDGFSLKWYEQLFRDRDLQEGLRNSIVLAALSCISAIFIGTTGAIGMQKWKNKANDYGKPFAASANDSGDYSRNGLSGNIFFHESALWNADIGDCPYDLLCTLYFYDGAGEACGHRPGD